MTGGGPLESCSGAPGILTQFEVVDLLNGGITPTLDTPSETYWFDNKVCQTIRKPLIPY
jgi:hypothetical protein